MQTTITQRILRTVLLALFAGVILLLTGSVFPGTQEESVSRVSTLSESMICELPVSHQQEWQEITQQNPILLLKLTLQ